MAYSEKSAARLAALHGEIEARKEHEFAAPTYRDTAALAEIRQTVFNQLESEHEHDRDTVEDSIAVLRYLAENYENMGRTAFSTSGRTKTKKGPPRNAGVLLLCRSGDAITRRA